ncbi:hypothetical protein [Pseudooceanicola sp.]|uniref:hypothetical protein n=1 Tax=Pseudooceanicola sp. TaxID=1914328 RepID=UPI003516A532
MDDEKIASAGELALGLLEGTERRDVLAALRDDAELRRAFRSWNEYLSLIHEADLAADVAPPARVFAGIEARLFGAPATQGWRHYLDVLRAPENRDTVLLLAVAKVALLAWLLWLFL